MHSELERRVVPNLRKGLLGYVIQVFIFSYASIYTTRGDYPYGYEILGISRDTWGRSVDICATEPTTRRMYVVGYLEYHSD